MAVVVVECELGGAAQGRSVLSLTQLCLDAWESTGWDWIEPKSNCLTVRKAALVLLLC